MEKNNMLMKLEQYQLNTPTAETKVMPQALRKEVKIFVKRYIGEFSNQVKNIKKLKYEIFINKFKKNIKQEKFEKYKQLIFKFDSKQKEFLEIYKQVYKLSDDYEKSNENIFYMSDNFYNEGIKISISNTFIDSIIKIEFDKLYNKGFKRFYDMLKQYEEKIEEAIIFGTVTDVYKLIKNYKNIIPYIKKLSDLEI